MKNRTILLITLTLMFVGFGLWTSAGDANMRRLSPDGLELQGHSNKLGYLLGEPVKAEFKFVNNGETTIKVPSGGVEVGSLKILIAEKENGEYKEYRASGWGRERGRRLDLKPGLTHAYSEVTILWNGKPRVSNLSENAIKERLEGRVTTEYAFQDAGIYWIKGLSYIGENFTPVESAPVRIEIMEPKGENLQVWNKIKGNREIAFLLQKGSFDTSDESRKQELFSIVEQILNEHPSSVYSGYLRPNLEKYKTGEARRQELTNKMQKPQ